MKDPRYVALKNALISEKMRFSYYRENVYLLLTNREFYPSPDRLRFLEELRAHRTHHLKGRSLYSHLLGTYRILKKWGEPEEICSIGLFHSIYGTYHYRERVLPLEERETLQKIIGIDAEKMVNYFCHEDRKHFPSNFERSDRLILKNWSSGEEIPLSRDEFTTLLTIHLADHLEQLPYVRDYRLGQFFLKARPFLSPIAYGDFVRAYGNRVPPLG